MRHRVGGFKLGRDTEHRKAMWRNMAVSLITHGQITTTIPKAKSLKPFIEKIISLAKKGDLSSRRRVIQKIGDPIINKAVLHERFDKDPTLAKRELKQEGYRTNRYLEVLDGPRVVKYLFDEVAPRFADRNGGYTRIIRLTQRRLGDGGQLCVLQLVGEEEGPQVSGQYSRRRDKANKRMEYAAKLRKNKGADKAEEAPVDEKPVDEADTAVATEEAPVADQADATEAEGSTEEKSE